MEAFDAADFRLTDFDTPDGRIPRDQWGRPLIRQTDGTLEPYTRTSTLAGLATDGVGLAIWKTRHVALAVARQDDLAAIIAGLDYGSPDLDARIEEVLERAKLSEPANWGTAVHRFTEPGAPAAPARFRDGRLTKDVDSYTAELERTGIEVICTEMFVVNDRLRVAGTFDHLYRLHHDTVAVFPEIEYVLRAGTVIVGDKKTGKLKPLQLTVQLSTYADSAVYDPETGRRTSLAAYIRDTLGIPDFQWDETEGCPAFDPSVGLSVHIPLDDGKTAFGFVDLEPGRALAGSLMHMHARRKAAAVRALLAPVPDRTDALACLHGTPACASCTATAGVPEPSTEPDAVIVEGRRLTLAEMAQAAANAANEHMEAAKSAVRAVEGTLRPPRGHELAETATAVLDELAARRGAPLAKAAVRAEPGTEPTGADLVTEPVKPKRRRRTKAEMEEARRLEAEAAVPTADSRVTMPPAPEPEPVVEIELPATPVRSPEDLWRKRIEMANSRMDLSGIWKEATAAGQWSPALELAGKARLQELSVKA